MNLLALIVIAQTCTALAPPHTVVTDDVECCTRTFVDEIDQRCWMSPEDGSSCPRCSEDARSNPQGAVADIPESVAPVSACRMRCSTAFSMCTDGLEWGPSMDLTACYVGFSACDSSCIGLDK